MKNFGNFVRFWRKYFVKCIKNSRTCIFIRIFRSLVQLVLSKISGKQMIGYESFAVELDGLLAGNLKVDATAGEKYVCRTLVFRLFDQIFGQKKALKLFATTFDQIPWSEMVNHVHRLIMSFDQALEIASTYQEQGMEVPRTDIKKELSEAVNFMGEDTARLVRTMGMNFRVSKDFALILITLANVDWLHVHHLSEFDAERVTLNNVMGDLDFVDFPPTPLEVALRVSQSFSEVLCSKNWYRGATNVIVIVILRNFFTI